MTDFLAKHFVKDYEDIEKMSVRTAYGVLASIVGIFCNVLLFAAKFIIGSWSRSVSIIADGFNNLSDAGSSIISFVGVKMANKPADEEHPFGHGRMEYIVALIVSFLVIEVGLSFLKDSIGKISEPRELQFHAISVVVLLLSVGVKLWLGLFNKKLGKRIDSKVMLAASADSMGDVITTSATIVSILVFKFAGVNIDSFVGIGVSLVVMWAGVGIARDTLEPLLGEAVPKDVYEKITAFVESYEGVYGTHDLIVHNYGPGRSMASVHAEVPNEVDIEISHEIIDRIERDVLKELGIYLVIHMDPVELNNEQLKTAKKHVIHELAQMDEALSIHDFRMVDGVNQINLIFDLVVPAAYNKEKRKEICQTLRRRMHEVDARYQCVIQVENSFIAEEK
ncbi:MAG: cation transporter [Tyzzerella sp.]|nr:cation transporter [Tyzzerella sp.]